MGSSVVLEELIVHLIEGGRGREGGRVRGNVEGSKKGGGAEEGKRER